MVEYTQHCERCKEGTGVTQMSLFNTEMCCNRCIQLERAHPKFRQARDAELEAISRGDYNFQGIGLPPSLVVEDGNG